jgi:hypothetical protein
MISTSSPVTRTRLPWITRMALPDVGGHLGVHCIQPRARRGERCVAERVGAATHAAAREGNSFTGRPSRGSACNSPNAIGSAVLGTAVLAVDPDYTLAAPAAQVYECRQEGGGYAWVLLRPEPGLSRSPPSPSRG